MRQLSHLPSNLRDPDEYLCPMFTREERKAINTDFYTALGTIMRPVPSETGRKVKWTNYRTGIKDFHIRLFTDKRTANFRIELQHRDEGIRMLFAEQLESFGSMIKGSFTHIPERSFAEPDIYRLECTLEDVSLYKKETWPDAFAFYKQCLIDFDAFWAMTYDVFKDLEA